MDSLFDWKDSWFLRLWSLSGPLAWYFLFLQLPSCAPTHWKWRENISTGNQRGPSFEKFTWSTVYYLGLFGQQHSAKKLVLSMPKKSKKKATKTGKKHADRSHLTTSIHLGLMVEVTSRFHMGALLKTQQTLLSRRLSFWPSSRVDDGLTSSSFILIWIFGWLSPHQIVS